MSDNDTSDDIEQEVVVRVGGLRDVSLINELYLDYCRRDNADPNQRPGDNETLLLWQLKRGRQQLMAQQNYVIVLAETPEGDVVGYCSIYVEENHLALAVPAYATLDEIYVTEPYRNRTTWQALFERCGMVLAAQGIDNLLINSAFAYEREILEEMGCFEVSRLYALPTDKL